MIDSTIAAQTTPEAPENCWTNAEQTFFATLPRLTSFQSMVEADSFEEAQSRTFLETPLLPENSETYEFDTPADAATLAAFGLVGSPIEEPYRLVRSGTNYPERSGIVLIQLQRTMAEHSTLDEKYFANEARIGKNFAGCIMEDLWDWMRQQGGPWIHEIVCDLGPYRVMEEEGVTLGRFQTTNLSIVWGLGTVQ